MIHDVKLDGLTAQRARELVEQKNIYLYTAELYYTAVLVGLFEGKGEEWKPSEAAPAHINSRTWMNKRPAFEDLIRTFVKLEKKLKNEPFSIKEVFNHENEEEEEEKELNILLKSYAIYGIDAIYKDFEEAIDDYDIISIIDNQVKTKEQIDEEMSNISFRHEEEGFLDILKDDFI